MRWVEPDAIAFVAAAFHPLVKLEPVPQSRGTYSKFEGMDEVVEPQL
jgi:hypothetical protein